MENQTNEKLNKFKSKDFLITIVTMAIFTVGIFIGPILEYINSNAISDSFPASEPTKAWYEGGNLHKATMREWRSASYENQLATMADAIGVYIGSEKAIPLLANGAPTLKTMAGLMVDCMNNFNNSMFDNEPIGEYVFICFQNYDIKKAADKALGL